MQEKKDNRGLIWDDQDDVGMRNLMEALWGLSSHAADLSLSPEQRNALKELDQLQDELENRTGIELTSEQLGKLVDSIPHAKGALRKWTAVEEVTRKRAILNIDLKS